MRFLFPRWLRRKRNAALPEPLRLDVSREVDLIWPRVQAFTMTGRERVTALCQSIAHLEAAGIAGDVVECGVWKGGSMMAAALMLLARQSTGRHLYLFDTFSGMTPPDDVDCDLHDRPARAILAEENPDTSPFWAHCARGEVQAALAGTGYPLGNVHFVAGRVEDTVPAAAPERIALLRLDTDWYASTKHELVHLYPRLVPGGIMIVDDFGHWQGARRAVEEHFAGQTVELHAIDYTARLVCK